MKGSLGRHVRQSHMSNNDGYIVCVGGVQQEQAAMSDPSYIKSLRGSRTLCMKLEGFREPPITSTLSEMELTPPPLPRARPLQTLTSCRKNLVRDCQGISDVPRPNKHGSSGSVAAGAGRGSRGVRDVAPAGVLPRRNQNKDADGP